MPKSQSYEEFVDKFKPKKTTDDCYTPPEVYDAVLAWVRAEYDIADDVPIVRPFWPGADYERAEYPDGCVVVDNPPFSIMAKIIRFYQAHGVRFFLFAPALTLFSAMLPGVTCIAADLNVTYANGAAVCTGFRTNLEPGVVARTAPDLTHNVQEVADEVARRGKKRVPVYSYPPELLTAARLGYIGTHGQSLKIREGQCVRVAALDAQRASGKAVFGGGLLLSERAAVERAAVERAAVERAAVERAAAERAAVERAAAERAAAHVWELSDRERQLVASMPQHVTAAEPEPQSLF